MKRIAIAGCAHIHTPNFVKILKAREDVKVTGVWDHDARRAKENADILNTKVYASDAEIWDDSSIDAVVICSETNRHRELVLRAAKTKKHMFVEKPLGFAGRDALEMADAIEKSGVLFQTGYFMRGNPVHLFLKQQIEAGVFGTITRIRHSNCHCGSLGGWFDTQWRWMADPAIAGCGAFGDLGTHSLDILMWFLGVPERVAADIRTVTGRYGADCDESGEGLLHFPSGTVGTLAGGWVDLANPVTCEISGTEGHAAVVNGQLYFKSNHVTGADGKEPWTALPAEWPHAFVLFLEALAGKKVKLVSAREAALRSVVMETLYKAAKHTRWETVAF